ncbi:reverse transcriptase [Chryseobacterium sp. T16E-39]|uniref:RNA-directed DNA polymerase n=1 Tax=Chryseobacterium sp. T16E-39 TaxID=2015076 RepID=UPI000B5B2244|nr:RNA-directed DNA polymerase [Chryseobacterium sp. T16E-39]ASK32697.1 reverse transcriptase [Chryseobacterium sp. T16E-39]
MKRAGSLFQKITSLENLILADGKAQKGKSKQYGVIAHNKNKERNIASLNDILISKTYKTSNYSVFKVYEPKEREVYKLPYFPDRICHHAIMNILEPIFLNVFTADSYSCIKGKGIHAASFNLRKALKNEEETTFCLKLDIKKFYPNVDHDILKSLLRRKFKDQDLLWLLDEIIDSSPGLPIGNYLSQYFANFYLTYFDHWIKERLKAKYYFRYADDIVILNRDKEVLHRILYLIKSYFEINLKLQVKENWQVFPVKVRGIDFVGYKHFHSHTLLRKSIKKRFARMLKTNPKSESIASYKGWTKHCNSKNLLKKLIPHETL